MTSPPGRLQHHADAVAAAWRVPAVRVVLNGRLRTTAGRAIHRTRTVELAKWLMAAPCDEVLETLAHELAHVIAHDFEPRSRPHGDLWRAVATALGGRGRARYEPALARHWRRVFYYECARGCLVPRQAPMRRRRRRRTVCTQHGLALALRRPAPAAAD